MRIVLLILLFVTAKCFPQPHFYEFPSSIPGDYSFNVDSMLKAIHLENKDLKEKDRKEYAEGLTYYHRDLLTAGQIYFNCHEMESYLNKLLDKIVAINNSKKKFRAFIVREEDVNASAVDNGIVYVNIGLLAKIKDEAALSVVIAHEVSHALNYDSKKIILQNQNQPGKTSIKDLLARSHGSRIFEARADSCGFRDATALGYDIKSSYNTFIGFESEYNWYKSQYSYQDPKWHVALDNLSGDNTVQPDSLDKFLSDHPDNFRRIALLNRFLAEKNGTRSFIESESTFEKIKKLARLEVLYIDLQEGNYKDCLRNAFYYHLFDQNNPDLLYYISESLRRIILNEPDIKRKGFLTENSKEKKFENHKGILHDISYISLDTSLKRLLLNDTVYGRTKKPFETYLQAGNYFLKKALNAKSPGILLTAGLYEINRNKNEKGFAHLSLYAADSNALFKEFSQELITGNLVAAVRNNKNNYVYIKNTDYYKTNNGDAKFIYSESISATENMNAILISEFTGDKNSNYKILLSDSMTITDFQETDDLVTKLKSFKNQDEADNENRQNKFQSSDYWKNKEMQDPLDAEVLCRNKNFFLLEPASYDWFKQKQAKSITIIKPYVYSHPVLGLFFYLEISYFDPIHKKYLYFDQEYLKNYSKGAIKGVVKTFKKTLEETTGTNP
jgi:hypothetical protein